MCLHVTPLARFGVEAFPAQMATIGHDFWVLLR